MDPSSRSGTFKCSMENKQSIKVLRHGQMISIVPLVSGDGTQPWRPELVVPFAEVDAMRKGALLLIC